MLCVLGVERDPTYTESRKQNPLTLRESTWSKRIQALAGASVSPGRRRQDAKCRSLSWGWRDVVNPDYDSQRNMVLHGFLLFHCRLSFRYLDFIQIKMMPLNVWPFPVFLSFAFGKLDTFSLSNLGQLRTYLTEILIWMILNMTSLFAVNVWHNLILSFCIDEGFTHVFLYYFFFSACFNG